MAWVSEISEDKATPELKPLYDAVRANYGFVPNFFKAQGRSPELIEAEMKLGHAILKDGALPLKIKEEIGVVVSGVNTSSYCIAIHMEVLRNLGVEKALSRKLAMDYANAPVEPKVLALFRFAEKLTRKQGDVEQADFEAAKAAGWDEAALFEATMAVAWFNYINRVSIGLGLVADF